MQQLAEEWNDTTVFPVLSKMIEICGERLDKVNARYKESELQKLRDLCISGVQQLLPPEQLRFIKVCGKICVKVSH